MLCLRGDSEGSSKGAGIATSQAPETPPAQAKRAFKPPSLLMGLPSELLDRVVLNYGPDPQMLCSMAMACHTLKTVSEGAQEQWRALFAVRWGLLGPVQTVAAELAGGWHRLYASRHMVERESAPWLRPSPYEVEAAVRCLAAPAAADKGGVAPGPSSAAVAGEAEEAAAPAAAESGVCVVFMVDGSGSVTEEDFEVMTDFMTCAVGTLRTLLGPGPTAAQEEVEEEEAEADEEEEEEEEAAEGGAPALVAPAIAAATPLAQVAVLQFSNDVRVELPPTSLDPDTFADAMAAMHRMNGGTNIAMAIQRAGQMLKPLGPGVRRALVLLTDGRVDSHQAREAHVMAARLADEQAGVSLHAFGVGRGVDRQELVHIVGGAGGREGAEERYLGLCTLDEAPW